MEYFRYSLRTPILCEPTIFLFSNSFVQSMEEGDTRRSLISLKRWLYCCPQMSIVNKDRVREFERAELLRREKRLPQSSQHQESRHT